MNESDAQQSAIEYVELEVDTTVKAISLERKFNYWEDDYYIFSAETTDSVGEWWIVSGETPTNLYLKSDFKNADYVFSFHNGLMDRLVENEANQSSGTIGDMNYDVFISHAGEDKDEFVEPLAQQLDEMGLYVWYDDFQLNVGDSLRESIDEGLSKSHVGAVVLSDAFFGKDWPEYELNGLTAREMGGGSIILPIWYQIQRADVVEYSPSLADRVAIRADGSELAETAGELATAIESTLINRIEDERG